MIVNEMSSWNRSHRDDENNNWLKNNKEILKIKKLKNG